jgi:hypothetical protein
VSAGREASRVVAPNGDEFLIRVEGAPRLGLFIATPARWLNTLRGDRSWRLSVEEATKLRPILREKFAELEDANERRSELEGLIERGEWPSGTTAEDAGSTGDSPRTTSP